MAKQAGTGLTPEVVDVFLSTLEQAPGPHTSSQGRLINLVNGQVRHYAGAGQPGERVVVDQRYGFQNLTNAARDVSTGATAVPPVSNPELLHGLANQLVSVSGAVPRVYAGSTPGWSAFPTNRYLSQTLDESVFHTTDNVLEVPSGVVAGDACGFVWTDTNYDDTGQPIQAAFFGIRSVSLGTWILTPRLLYQSVTNSYFTRAQVVSDGHLFWVFWNATPPDLININVYTQSGVLQAFSSVNQVWHSSSPGYWDATFQSGLVMLCQPGANGPLGSERHVKTSKMTVSGATVTITEAVDTTMHCQGPVMWLTNDASPWAYLATWGADGKVYGYQVNASTLTQNHEYPTAAVTLLPDSFAGWTVDAGGGTYTLNVAWSTLATSNSPGPQFDPAYRQTKVYQVGSSASFGTLIRTNNSTCLVSRAFAVDGEYYANTYYQSGSGQVLAQAPIAVTLASGDTFIGNGIQTVPVQAGDYTTGAAFNTVGTPGTAYFNSTAFVSANRSASLASGDTVAPITASGLAGIADGAPVLQWTVAAMNTLEIYGGILEVSGSSGVAGADGNYYIVGYDLTAPHIFYTLANTTSAANPSGTFGTGGSANAVSMVVYNVPQNPVLTSDAMQAFYAGGSIVVTGSGTADGTKTINHMFRGVSTAWPAGMPDRYFVLATTETFSNNTFSATVSPASPGLWHFGFGPIYDSSLDGAELNVTGAVNSTNNGLFTITNAGTGFIDTDDADASATVPEIFGSPPPSMSINLALDQTPYTFTIASVTTDYTFYNAQVQIANSPDSTNNGVYKIVWLDPNDAHRFQATPTDGLTNQVNQNLIGPTTVTIVKAVAVQPETQPCWYITPLDNNRQPQAGCYERGLAYADWHIEGDSAGPDLFPCSLSNVFAVPGGLGWLLPFRAKAVTAGQVVVPGSNIIETSQESTIGLKLFQLLTQTGQATEAFQELVMPGPLAGGFTASGFQEQGMLIGPETPFLVGEENDTGTFGMTPGTILVQAVWEATDENGERVLSYPSAVLQFVLEPGMNTATYGGRSPLPFQSSGVLDPASFGLSNRTHITLSLYRTATVQGVPTTQLYKVTNDLNPNGLYSGSGTGSGFTFPDEFTWNYRDQSLDAAIVNQEPLYTSQGQLPRFPGPANSQGCVWQNRTWLTGYDGVVWMSGDKQEGDANWFFPGYRILCGNDKVLTCAAMEQYLVMGAERGMWYIPAARFPDNTGSGGSLPTPNLLPFPNGCTGFSATIDIGTAYSSTAGGVWLVTRDLKNVWLSEPVKDSLTGSITDIQVDTLQRLVVANGTSTLFVYDPIPRMWYTWTVPNPVIKLTTWLGTITYQDASAVMQQAAGTYHDTTGSGAAPYCPDITLALLLFAQARAVKQCWGLQLVGTYQGPHSLNAVISYPDDPGEAPTSFGPFVPDPSAPYVYEINPKVEEASSYLVRVFGTPTSTGNSFSLELIGAEVGADGKQGTFKVPPSSRITAT